MYDQSAEAPHSTHMSEISHAGEELTLRDIFLALRDHWTMIAIVIVIFAGAGALYAVLTKPLYIATALIQPVTDQNGGMSLPGGLGSAAALAGIDLGGADTQRQHYLAVLGSREMAEQFIEQKSLLPELFPKRWNEAAQSWYGPEDRSWTAKMKAGIAEWFAELSEDEGYTERTTMKPTMWEAYSRFQQIRQIEPDETTGLLQFSMQYEDPVAAANWANAYIDMIDDELRERSIRESARALDYLQGEGAKTTVNEVRQTIFELVEAHLEKATLANTSEEFAFRIVDPAVVPEQPSHPRRLLIIAICAILGAVIGSVAAIVREAVGRPAQPS